MSRPLSFLPALVAVTAALMPALAAPAAGVVAPTTGHEPRSSTSPVLTRAVQHHPAARPTSTSPLSVELSSITPSYLPDKGPIEVTGTVTNQSDEPWQAINMHAFLGSTAITSPAELADAAALPESADVGDRIYQDGTFDNVGDLEPGESTSFTITLAHRYIERTGAGVYWFGVHALGQDAEGRDGLADGRARTFLPMPPQGANPETVSLVVPVRHAVHHAADGHVTDVRAWTRDLSVGGRLSALADFGEAAGGRSITWLVDPAVPDTVSRLVDGNAPRNLQDDPDDSPATPSPGEASASASGTTSAGAASARPNAAAGPGKAWLDRMKTVVAGHHVLALPYGDVDVSAAADRDPSVLQAAIRRSAGQIPEWGVRTTPGIAPPDGFLDPTSSGLLDTRETVLVTDQMFGDDAPAAVRVDGVRMLTTASGPAQGGPAPGDPLSMLAVRQRLLSEAALRMLDAPRQPLIVVLPQDWVPTQPTAFFAGLDVDWLHLAPADTATQRAGTTRDAGDLYYPEELAAQEVPQVNFTAVDRLGRLGDVLQDVLTRNEAVGQDVADQGMTALSYAARLHPDRFRVEADRGSAWIQRRLDSVRIIAPRGVTLASASGSFGTVLVNRLDQAVTVRIKAVTDPDLKIEDPGTFDLSAGGRQTVPIRARALTPGVHRVKLRITSSDGAPLGPSKSLPIRSAQVSDVIWLILGVGLALLFGAVVVRVVRRIRGESRE